LRRNAKRRRTTATQQATPRRRAVTRWRSSDFSFFLFLVFFWFCAGGITQPHGIIDYPVRSAYPHAKILIFADSRLQAGRTTTRKNQTARMEKSCL
jgi:hypothetical protein